VGEEELTCPRAPSPRAPFTVLVLCRREDALSCPEPPKPCSSPSYEEPRLGLLSVCFQGG
jgi:hypothetical protein